MALRLRPAQAGDEPLLGRLLWLAVHWDAVPPPPAPAEGLPTELARYVAGFGRPGDLGLVAEDDGAVGAAWLRLFGAADRGYGWVSDDVPELSVAVVPVQRGRGVGSRLLEGLLGEADSRSLPGVSLSVAKANPAVAVYERHGFARVGELGESWTMLRRIA